MIFGFVNEDKWKLNDMKRAISLLVQSTAWRNHHRERLGPHHCNPLELLFVSEQSNSIALERSYLHECNFYVFVLGAPRHTTEISSSFYRWHDNRASIQYKIHFVSSPSLTNRTDKTIYQRFASIVTNSHRRLNEFIMLHSLRCHKSSVNTTHAHKT